MGLKETVGSMQELLMDICYNLDKANKGNKAASQRVRTTSIQFEKIAKKYRKESIAASRGGRRKSTKRKAAPKRKAIKKRAAPKRKTTRRKTTAKRKPARRKTARRR